MCNFKFPKFPHKNWPITGCHWPNSAPPFLDKHLKVHTDIWVSGDCSTSSDQELWWKLWVFLYMVNLSSNYFLNWEYTVMNFQYFVYQYCGNNTYHVGANVHSTVEPAYWDLVSLIKNTYISSFAWHGFHKILFILPVVKDLEVTLYRSHCTWISRVEIRYYLHNGFPTLAKWHLNSLWPSDAIWWQIWVKLGSGNGLLPDGTKPLPEPMLTDHQWHS